MTDAVILKKHGRCGLITLNRPEALNALTLDMVRALDPQLRAWAVDPDITHIVIEGAGEKGFCAGGDIRALHDWGKAGAAEATGFFREEYVVNHLIKHFPKPYTALMDGVTMGGGVGVSVHGQFRIVTDRTVFAMPETGIGLLPDVGGTYFLPRLPGQLGAYLVLTGNRFKAADCLFSGVATHYVPNDSVAEVRAALLEGDHPEQILAAYEEITEHCRQSAPIKARQNDIERLFVGDRVSDIIARLAEDTDPWAHDLATIIVQKSPTSCAVALHQMRAGASASFDACMKMEMRAVTRIMAQSDFYEGVRAVIIDKDQKPQWSPARHEDVTAENVAYIFSDLGGDELQLTI